MLNGRAHYFNKFAFQKQVENKNNSCLYILFDRLHLMPEHQY